MQKESNVLVSFKASLIIAVVLLVFISAIAVILSKYQSRLIFIEIGKQEELLHDYEVEWGQLQLELTTLTEENRIERVAKQHLKLRIPQRDQVIYLKSQ